MLPTVTLPKVDTGPFRFGAADSGNAPEPVNWRPLPGPQAQAYGTRAFETLYGGAAGGGKSDLLLGLARREHKKSLLLRRTFPDAERSLIVRSQEFFGDVAKYNSTKHAWKIDGRRIEIGHLEYDKNVYQYQGASYDLIGFDELTQFTCFQYEYLLSRARTTNRRQRVRVVATSNPGGEGNDWVMTHWAAWLDETHPNPAKPGELRWYKRLDDGCETETTADDPDGVSRTFIPARLSDNPHLGDDYRRTLAFLPEPLRSQLANGDWKAGMVDDAYQVIPRGWVKAAQARWKPQPPRGAGVVGCDVARGGEDKTAIARRVGYWLSEVQKHPGRLTPTGRDVVTLLVGIMQPDDVVNLDIIGVGASAFDNAVDAGLNVVGVNFAEGSRATDTSGKLSFANKRAEGYWRLRETLDPNSGKNAALPPDPELLGDLCAPRWKMTTRGVQIEDKDAIKARINRSPDCGDCAVLAFMEDDTWLIY